MSRLDAALVALVTIAAIAVGAYLVSRVDPSPSPFERATCSGRAAVRRAIARDDNVGGVRAMVREMAHEAGRVEDPRLRKLAINARLWMHRVRYQLRRAGVADPDAFGVAGVPGRSAEAARAWTQVERSLGIVDHRCERLGLA